jgi:methylmalonyl-CoA mutase
MAAASPPLSLAGDFPPVSGDRWLELVAAALKRDPGDDVLAGLRSVTYDDITIEPLYTAADAVDPAVLAAAGGRPARHGPWDVRQLVDATAGAGRVLEELERGATSVWLDLQSADDVVATIEAALEGVLLDVAPVVLAAGSRWAQAAQALSDLWAATGAVPAPGGSLGADPLGAWASDRSRDRAGELADAAAWATRLAGAGVAVRTVTIDGARYHDAGASDAQELGATVAAAVATMRELEAAGVAEPFAAVELRLAATGDQFATIAKFRAVRRIWARVGDAAGDAAAAAGTPVHAVGSTAMLTRYDPAVNMLRSTVACFAAGVAGADAITLLPFDSLSAAVPSELGRRLARNTQSVLALESNLGAVADPAGGSWYVERRTAELAERAWRFFQEIEAAGGFAAAVESVLLGERIAATRTRRDDDVDHRRAPLTGVSEFPNIAEPAPVAAPDVTPAPAGGLERHRWAERFEALRSRVDVHAAAHGRPTAYLATLGTPADFTARVTFTKNFFEVAGIETIVGPVDGFGVSGARLACVCSSNGVYADQLDGALEALRGARAVYVAGRDPVVAGGNALAALTAIVDELGVAERSTR